MVMQLRSCCCGCTLRTGSIIIAVLGIISSIFIIGEGSGFLPSNKGGSNKNTTRFSISDPLGTALDTSGFDLTVAIPTTTEPPVPSPAAGNGTSTDDVPGEAALDAAKTVGGVVRLIINILLLVGAIRNSAKMVFPWIVLAVIICIYNLIILLILGVMTCIYVAVLYGVGTILVGLIFTVLEVYYILVVNSFHTTLKAGPPVSRA